MNEPTGVEARVCADIAARQRVGIAKYGVTLEESSDDTLRHAYEEALDLSAYLRAEWERRQETDKRARNELARAEARADAALEECDHEAARYERGFAAGIAFALARRDAR